MTMLDRMRRHKGWLKWSLGLVVLTFVVFFIPQDFLQTAPTTAGASPREVVAEVDGHPLTVGDFQQRYFAAGPELPHAVRRQHQRASCCVSSGSISRS